jgi:hypothetical protein
MKMKKIILFITVVFVFQNCVFNAENNNQIIVDKSIQKKVESEIIDTFPKNQKECELEYINYRQIDSYINDSLQKPYNSKHKFYSAWGTKGDSAEIYGYFGGENAGSVGFRINLASGSPKVFLFIYPHLMGRYSYTKDGEVEFNMDVPTKKSKVILSQMPDNQSSNIIYGYVELETVDFYSATKYNSKEIPNQRDKVRANLRVYFKANKCDSLLYE